MGWEDVFEIEKDKLVDKFYDSKFYTNHLPDGAYELRASANCLDKDGNVNSINYSEIVEGKIDRKSAFLFGTPSPSNQILNFGQDISVEFDKNIDNSISYFPGKISLQRMDNNKYLPLTYTVSGNKMIIKPNPASLLDGLEGVLLKATVIQIRDLSGNATLEPIEWTFKVNRSPIYWENRFLTVSVESGSVGKVTGRLKNAGISGGTFTNLVYPFDKIVPNLFSGTIAAGGFQDIEFSTKAGLTPGLYKDSIMVQSGSYTLKTYIQIEILSPQPRWIKQTLNPAKFEDRMNFVVQFSTDKKLDTPLSSDIKDVIGVFYKDSLRGKANIEYNPQLRKYYAYLTAYGNSNQFDSLTFRMWDAYPGIQYRAIESKVFKNGAVIGQVNSPFILHPLGVYQTLNLKQGWNWIGLFVKNNNQTPEGIFGKMIKDTMTIIKTQNTYAQFGGERWYGNMDSLRPGIGYMLKASKPDTIEIYGSTYGSEIKSTIEGNQNWSWVGNADLFGSTITKKLSNLKLTNNDIIIGEQGFSLFDGTNWNGSLNYLDPGSAYKIRTNLPGEFKNQKFYKTLPNWNLDFNGFEHNMNVTAEILKGSARVFDSHYLVGAFINGTCQGLAQPVFSEKLNRYLLFLTVYGDNSHIGQNITLKLFDTDLGAEIPQSAQNITFNKESIYGTIPYPLDIVINTSGIQKISKVKPLLLCYPNPFNSQIHIDLNLSRRDEVEILITDALGRTIETIQNGVLNSGNHTWIWDGSKTPLGIYFCITKINGEVMRTAIMKK
jgi:hypothetical protein